MNGSSSPRVNAAPIRDVILSAIEKSDLNVSEKADIGASVRALSEAHMEAITAGLAREGLARLPDAMNWLRKWIPQS